MDGEDDYDSSSSMDSLRQCSHNPQLERIRRKARLSSTFEIEPPISTALLRPIDSCGLANASFPPIPPCRSIMPVPMAPHYSYVSEVDRESCTALIQRRNWLISGRRPWWLMGADKRRRRRRKDTSCSRIRPVQRVIRLIAQHPLFPTSPPWILLTLFLLILLAMFVTLVLIHILDPDKEPLPWRAYCTVDSPSNVLQSVLVHTVSSYSRRNRAFLADRDIPSSSEFPSLDLDSLPPAGIFLGVFSMDSAVERRMLIRSSWASHSRSRNGAGGDDDGIGTSRTIVRFILGKPRTHWERRVQLEAETYNDIVILPIGENMNSGKTYAFFTWASKFAWVPQLLSDTSEVAFTAWPSQSYSANLSSRIASHDPMQIGVTQRIGTMNPGFGWARPDFVLKVDDDSFVMLAELEGRLRMELYVRQLHPVAESNDQSSDDVTSPIGLSPVDVGTPSRFPSSHISEVVKPLVYWGYLVKNRFMAGELYALSWSLVEWIAHDEVLRSLTRGKEDKLVAQWMQLHPRAQAIRWKSEKCWIYDHPRAGTVYSHGFLFPSEVARVRRRFLSNLFSASESHMIKSNSIKQNLSVSVYHRLPLVSWTHSTVSTFGLQYRPPIGDLRIMYSVEALVEGSHMSMLRDHANPTHHMTPDDAWYRREGRIRRYESKRLGGTIVVHFIKKNPWYLETALAMLEGDDITATEGHVYERW